MTAPNTPGTPGTAPRRVVVVGGTRGIGAAITRAFAEAGDTVLVTGSDPEHTRRFAAGLAAAGHDVTGTVIDAASPDCGRRTAEEVRGALGGLDVLCLNAGIFPSSPLAELTAEALHRVLAINLESHVLTVGACLELLGASSCGRVVLTSSITGPTTGYPGWAHYGASKAGQLGFMRTAALELAPFGVTVNAVCPGNVATEGLADMGADYIAAMTASVPLGRLGTPEDIASAVLMLADARSGFITGQALVVDGGQTLPECPEAILPVAGA